MNLVLDDAHERVFSDTQGVEQVPLGLYLIRGDNVWVEMRGVSVYLHLGRYHTVAPYKKTREDWTLYVVSSRVFLFQ